MESRDHSVICAQREVVLKIVAALKFGDTEARPRVFFWRGGH